MSVSVFLACLYCFVGCMGYCLLVNIRGKVMLLACLGSALCWWVYVLCNGLGSDIFQCFIATVVVSIYSEILARKCKAPTTCFQIVSIAPRPWRRNLLYYGILYKRKHSRVHRDRPSHFRSCRLYRHRDPVRVLVCSPDGEDTHGIEEDQGLKRHFAG